MLLTQQVISNTTNSLASLQVTISGAKPKHGQIIVSLFSSEETYLKSPHKKRIVKVDKTGTVVVNFSELTPGEYALTAVYDENSNNEMDTNFIGIPKEKVGFSNNAKGRMGPASWEKAKLKVEKTGTTATIQLIDA